MLLQVGDRVLFTIVSRLESASTWVTTPSQHFPSFFQLLKIKTFHHTLWSSAWKICLFTANGHEIMAGVLQRDLVLTFSSYISASTTSFASSPPFKAQWAIP